MSDSSANAANQVGVDAEDLLINGDEDIADTDPDYEFLKLNDGIKKIITFHQRGGIKRLLQKFLRLVWL